MYRPQFAYATPPGCRDEEFTYYFDGSNTPQLNQGVSGLTLENIPLVLDQDAPFYWRGWKFGAFLSPSAPDFVAQYEVPNVQVKLRDPFENNLMDDYTPATQSGFAMNALSFNHGFYTGAPVVLEPEIYCPPGSVILAFLRAGDLALGSVAYPRISFHGVKRFRECA